ncbi:MAG: EB domain-containing protein [Myxococcota bacterium]|nr:EB domain-containing protein [Myxococcota bacterium]
MLLARTTTFRLFFVAVLWVDFSCKSEVCSTENIDETRPTRDVSCPNGTVCYGGECITACNAGSERFVRCENASECVNSARPFCENGFCSACDDGTYCVPSLNICAPVTLSVNDFGEPTGKETPTANSPLDAGPIDGAMFSDDAGVIIPIGRKPTHQATLSVTQRTIYQQGNTVTDSNIDVQVQNIENATIVQSATVAPSFVATDFSCDLLSTEQLVGTSSPADIGRIGVGNGFEATGFKGNDTAFVAQFLGGSYQILPPIIPADLLNFSTTEPETLSYLLFTVEGNPNLGLSMFPISGEALLHVPYELLPGKNAEIDTPANLRSGFQSSLAEPQKVVLLWNAARNITGSRILVRIVGASTEIRCVATEQSQRIEIISRLLEAFAREENVTSGMQFPIYFERSYARIIEVPVEMGFDTLVDFKIDVSHRHESTLQFQ